VVIGLSWVQLERLNPKPSPTHLARESAWIKVKVEREGEGKKERGDGGYVGRCQQTAWVILGVTCVFQKEQWHPSC